MIRWKKKKIFGKFLFLPNDCLEGKADMKSRIEKAELGSEEIWVSFSLDWGFVISGFAKLEG